MAKRPTRSDKYQYALNEVPVSVDILSLYSNSQSFDAMLNPFEYDERYLELKDELKELTFKIIDECLTVHQKAIIDMMMAGMTQWEIAKALGVNQSSITKSIHGNLDYTNGRKAYGGSLPKIRRHCMENARIKEILIEMQEILEEK